MSHIQQIHTFSKEITVTTNLSYLLYLPKDYDPHSAQRWPLLLFLHGASDRGEDVTKLFVHGPPKHVEEGQEFPFILLSPLCSEYSSWYFEIPALTALLDEIENTYAVDSDRIYLTGMSMGGYATWGLAIAHPQRFAAIAPICGAGNPNKVPTIRHIPTWVFHGDQDQLVPLSDVEATVNALKDSGGNVKFTLYPGVGHDSWTPAYENPELYTWLLSHKRSKQ